MLLITTSAVRSLFGWLLSNRSAGPPSLPLFTRIVLNLELLSSSRQCPQCGVYLGQVPSRRGSVFSVTLYGCSFHGTRPFQYFVIAKKSRTIIIMNSWKLVDRRFSSFRNSPSPYCVLTFSGYLTVEVYTHHSFTREEQKTYTRLKTRTRIHFGRWYV